MIHIPSLPIQQTDFLPLLGTDYIELYVGNAKQAAHYYKSAFGFQSLAYCGPETGEKDKVSYVLRQNVITLVLTTPLKTGNALADHIYKHGDGVKIIALKVDDARDAWLQTTERGAESYLAPRSFKDEDGELVVSGIYTYGETIHLFIERKKYHGIFMPGFTRLEPRLQTGGNRSATYRSLCGQCWLEPDEQMGSVLRKCNGLSQYSHFRRQRYFHRIFGTQ